MRSGMRSALRRIAAVAILVLFQAAASQTADAQSYPTRPITIIVPYPAGGPSDVLTRVLAERLKTALGQTIVVENVTGAGGSIGVGRVARAAPDGYMLAIGHNQTHVINAASMNLSYDVVKDFEPISLIADTPQWLISRKTLPPNNIKELIAWLKANKATSGSVGVGGPTDLSALKFQKETGTTFQFVPYRGGAPLIQDLIAGQIDMSFGQAANYLGPVRSGQLKAFAVLQKARWWAAPDVPTMDEAGVPGLHASFWHGLWAPKGTPKEIIARLDAAVIEALADPAVQQRLKDIGQQPWPRDKQTPEALAAQQKSEIEVWWPIIKANNIKGE
jgi:tripartite-type tricarboxylate transporter receptor subunit TctC